MSWYSDIRRRLAEALRTGDSGLQVLNARKSPVILSDKRGVIYGDQMKDRVVMFRYVDEEDALALVPADGLGDLPGSPWLVTHFKNRAGDPQALGDGHGRKVFVVDKSTINEKLRIVK